MPMLASSVGTSPRRCCTARRTSGHCRCASARIRSSSAPAIASYAEYSIPVTPPSSGPSRTVPRKRQLAPRPGPATSASRAAGEIGSRVRRPALIALPSRQRRQERDLVPVAYRGVEPHVPQIDRRERPLGQLRRARDSGADLPHDLRYRRGRRQRQLEILPPHELGVAGEELQPDQFPTVPVASPCQMRAALASGLDALDTTNTLTERSTTVPLSVTDLPSRRTTMGSAVPALPR